MAKVDDNYFPKVIEDMNASDQAAPTDRSWKVYAKADGIYARSSNQIVGPFGSTTGAATSFGSNAMAVGATSQAGTSGTYIGSDHRHFGLHSVTSSSSNTLWRPTINLRAGVGMGLTATDSDGDGNLDTVTFTSSGGGGGSAASTHVAKYKSGDESIANNTLQDDDHLVFPIAANEVWVVTYYLFLTNASSTPDFQAKLTGPAGSTLRWGIHGTATAATTNEASLHQQSHTSSALASGVVASGTIDNAVIFWGYCSNGGTAGNVTLQWSQVSTDAGNATVLKAGSFLMADKVA